MFGNTEYHFELTEDVNFKEQFNSNGVSNRKFSPSRDNNGIITGYTVTKTTIVIGGTNKIYKKVLSQNEVEPFMQIVLPEKNIMNVESVIFKESANYKSEPQSYEYYIDEEEFRFSHEEISTYRFFEVNSLSDQWRFGTESNISSAGVISNPYDTLYYEDYTETNDESPSASQKTTRYYKGVWKPITQKFITEYTDNGYLKLTFGGGTSPVNISDSDEGYTAYAKHMFTKMMNNDSLGVLPKAGWTMYVLYRTGGGVSANLAQGSINTIISVNCTFNTSSSMATKQSIIKSLSVKNISPSIGGKDIPSVSEIKYLTKYSIASQERCVTLKDYKAKILQIPPKYGCPFRLNAMEDNNKVIISCLGLNHRGKLDASLPSLMKDNIVEYLREYKSLGDYVELRSGKIYNLGFNIDVYIDKNYTPSKVIENAINTVYNYMDVNGKDMGEDIFVGDLERSLNQLDGVLGLISLKVYAIYGGNYSQDICPLPKYIDYGSSCNGEVDEFDVEGAHSFRIDIDLCDGILTSDYDSMFEILNKDKDITVRYKLR